MHTNAMRFLNFRYLPLLALAATSLASRGFADTIVTYPNPNQMVITYTGTVDVPLIVLQTHDTDTGLFYTTAGTGDPDMPVGTVIDAIGTLIDISHVDLSQPGQDNDYGHVMIGGIYYPITLQTWDFNLGGPVDITNQMIDNEVSIETRFGSISGWFPLGTDPVNGDFISANFAGGIVNLPDSGSTTLLLGLALAVLLSITSVRRRRAHS